MVIMVIFWFIAVARLKYVFSIDLLPVQTVKYRNNLEFNFSGWVPINIYRFIIMFFTYLVYENGTYATFKISQIYYNQCGLIYE